MKFGIAFDLKPDGPPPAGLPDDLHEEFDAPGTIHAIAEALRAMGHEAVELGDGREFLEGMLRESPEFVFNFAEGSGVSRNREARVPAVCEMLGVPYTGSDPLAMAVALEKDITRQLVAGAGLAVPRGLTISPPRKPYDGDFAEFPPILLEAGLDLPVIAKPVFEGSSKGIRSRCLVTRAADLGPTVARLWADYGQAVLIEEFIAGDEVTVGVLGNDPPEVFGVMRISPKTPAEHFVYSLEVKRDYRRLIDYECPAKLAPGLSQEIAEAALTVFDLLGCRDVARLDFRVRDGVPYFLEINPLPGLNPESSDLVIMAGLLGVTHAELVGRIVEAAISRTKSDRKE